MKNYHPTVMFELLYGAMQRNTVYQRLVFEQGQLGRPLEEKEIDKIWEAELQAISDYAVDVESDIAKAYGNDGFV
ncbi:MAG: hypothetical protein LBV79_02320 [Candidatus Adiutrix sp.]|nr:hypothetical protein [Candidatus Adiutrix sp.]